MTNPTIPLLRDSRRTVLAGGLLLAAVGLVVMILTGVPGFPLVPPGPIILVGAALVVALVPWRWAPVVGLAAALFLIVGAIVSGTIDDRFAAPELIGQLLGTVINLAGLAVAVVAGVLAVAAAVRSR